MFDKLSDRLGGVFDKLRGRGALREEDVRGAMREVRIALLEADVALPVVKDFVEKVTEKAVGQSVLKSVTPGQQVVKIVNDGIAEMLGSEVSALELSVAPPAIIMMVGLQEFLTFTVPPEAKDPAAAAASIPLRPAPNPLPPPPKLPSGLKTKRTRRS